MEPRQIFRIALRTTRATSSKSIPFVSRSTILKPSSVARVELSHVRRQTTDARSTESSVANTKSKPSQSQTQPSQSQDVRSLLASELSFISGKAKRENGPGKPGSRLKLGELLPGDGSSLALGGFGRNNSRLSISEENKIPITAASPTRLDSSTGRSIEINPTRFVDLGRAIKLLDSRLSSNAVRSDFYKQRFHERPGLKRKRLRSQRWQKRFKDNFQAIVRRVEELRRKGW